MEYWPPHIYRQRAENEGLSSAQANEALRSAHRVQDKGLPAILSLRHLSERCDVSYRLLRDIVGRQVDPYKRFAIKKHQGGTRLICVPQVGLRRVQSWLSSYVLSGLQAHHKSFAFHQGSSPRACAELHCGAKWLIKLDVVRFFEHISEIDVFHIYRNAGYRNLVAFELARLCTCVFRSSKKRYTGGRWTVHRPAQRYSIQKYFSRKIGHLPQGAPSSPKLSNLCVRGLDERLEDYAKNADLVYSRYADDIVFSTGGKFSRAAAKEVLRDVSEAFGDHGLKVNHVKSQIVPPGARKVVLGLLVDGCRPRLPKEFRNNIDCHIHYIESADVGLEEHRRTRGFDSVLGLKRHLDGLLTYAEHIDPGFAESYRKRFEAIAWPV